MKIIRMEKEMIMGEDREFESPHGSTLLSCGEDRILTAWFGGSWEKGPDTAIWTAVRSQGGWSRPRKTGELRGIACWNPVLSAGADGRILLYYKVGPEISHWRTYVMESFDRGETFSQGRELVAGDESGGRGPVKNKPIRLRDGTVLAPASLEGEIWDAFVDRSQDDGRTWQKSAMVPLRRVLCRENLDSPYNKYHCYGKGIIQPALWEDERGEVHMLLRSTSSRIFRSDSADGGRTWGLAYDTGMPNNNSGLDLVRLPGGGIVLACNPRENAPDYYKGARTPLTLFYSGDNGDSFQELAVIEDGRGSFAYPAIVCGGRGELLMTYTWNRRKIGFCRLHYMETE